MIAFDMQELLHQSLEPSLETSPEGRGGEGGGGTRVNRISLDSLGCVDIKIERSSTAGMGVLA